MVTLIVSVFILGYGVWYAKNPLPYLRRRFGREDIPKTSVKTARIVGVILAVLGLAGVIWSAVKLAAGQ